MDYKAEDHPYCISWTPQRVDTTANPAAGGLARLGGPQQLQMDKNNR